MDFGFEQIDNLNLANLVGKVMDNIMKYQIFFAKVYRIKKAKNYQKITKPLLHYKSQNLLEPLLDINVKTSMFSVSQL